LYYTHIEDHAPLTLEEMGTISSGRVCIMNTISGISDPILVYLEALNEV